MKLLDARWTEWLRKAACSLAAVCLVVWWGQSGPRPRAEASLPLPPEAAVAPASSTGTMSPFVIEGLPGPVTERPGPVPLLEDSVQLLRFRNLDWTLYLDEPADPASSVDRLQAAMSDRGWQAKEIPARARVAPSRAEGLLDGRVLVRGGALCLVHRMRTEEARDLLFVACRGTF